MYDTQEGLLTARGAESKNRGASALLPFTALHPRSCERVNRARWQDRPIQCLMLVNTFTHATGRGGFGRAGNGGPAYRLVENRQYVLFAEDQKLIFTQLHLGAGVLGKENALTGLHGH